MHFSVQTEELSSSVHADIKHQLILELDVPLLYFIDLLQIAAEINHHWATFFAQLSIV